MKQRSRTASRLATAGAIAFSILVIAALITSKGVALSGLTHLHFNPFGIISVVSTLGTLIILIRIMSTGSRSEETGWFMLVLLGQLLFAGGEAMQRFSLDRSAVIFWTELSGAGASLLGIASFLFATAYVSSSRRQVVLAPFFIWTSVIVTIFYAEGNLFFDNNPAHLIHYPWGYNNASSSAFWIALVWIVVPGVMAATALFRFRHTSDHPLLRKQALLFGLAILVPMLVGLCTDGVLPILGIAVLPPLSTLFELVTCVLIFYGLSRYQFFQINPAILAENVLTTMSEAVVVTRSDFTVEYVNSEAERLLKLEDRHLSHVSIHTLFSPDSWPKIHAYIRGEVTNEDDLGEVTLIDEAGKQTPVRIFISRLEEGKFQAYVFVISDISDIVESYQKLESDSIRIRHLLGEAQSLEEQLKQEKAGVEHTVAVRTEELRKAQKELQESDKLKTEFIMLGSHNLRTPITIMASSLEMLKETQDNSERLTYIESLEQGITRLKDFVEDMVTIVSLEAGTGQRPTATSIAALLQPIINETGALATTKPQVRFLYDMQQEDTVINANAVWLRGAFRNLLSNAYKFTENGSITLHAERVGQTYRISITDTGIGIAAEEIPKLFTKFHRGTDTLAYEYEGKGIGLYLTKLIIDQHGGTIQVVSQLDHGSTFTVSLPVVTTETIPEVITETSSPAA